MAFTEGNIVFTKRQMMGRNGNVIQAGTVGIVVVANKSQQKIGVQFQEGKNKIIPIIRCFPSNLRSH